MKVGTFPWLIQHELRLWWRDLSQSWRSSQPLWIFLGVASLALGGLAVLSVLWDALSEVREVFLNTTPPVGVLWIAVIAWIGSFLYAFYIAMERSLVALFDRGDLDLLVSSPVSSKVIFASRWLSVVIEVFLGFSLLVVPFSLLVVLVGIPKLLGIYPALIGLSLTATSLAMLLVLWLVRFLGARRARTFAQVLTAVLSTLLFVAVQLTNLSQTSSQNIGTWTAPLRPLFVEGGPLGPDSLVWFPARTIFLDPLSVLLTILFSSALAWLTIEILHRSFVQGTQQSVTAKRAPAYSTQAVHFRQGFTRILLFKEWRIIGRNPYLLSQTFLQLLFFIPLLFVVARDSGGSGIAGLTTVLPLVSVLVGSQLTMTLTGICAAGEEASDLLKSSPVPGKNIRRLKLLAALIPPWVLLSPLFLVLIVQGAPWLIPLVIFLSATTCSAMLRLWNARPIPMADLFGRQRKTSQSADVFLSVLEAISVFAWAALAFSLGSNHGWLTGISLVVVVPTFALGYARSRALGTSLGF